MTCVGRAADRAAGLFIGLFARAMRLTPADTGRIAEGVCAVKAGCVNFYVYSRGGALICFDAGFRSAEIGRLLKLLGVEPAKVSHVFLTHSDFDHAGGLPGHTPGSMSYLADVAYLFVGDTFKLIGGKVLPMRRYITILILG